MEIIDKSNMRQVIQGSPDQLRAGLDLAKDITLRQGLVVSLNRTTREKKIKGNFKNIVLCGMGGSALPGDILRSLSLVEIYIHKDYGLPDIVDKKSLVICISYSGNTEETVSALKEAIEKKLNVLCIASGGIIEEKSKANNIPFVKLPSGMQPRSAIGYIFSALVKSLENTGLIKGISQETKKTAELLDIINESLEKEGKQLSKKLINKIPILYAAGMENAISIARIWKIKFNENSKIPAFYNYFPELNHNEMVGFSKAKKIGVNFHTLMFQDIKDHPRNIKRMELTADLLMKQGISSEIIKIKDGSPIFKIFSTLLLGDWVSYYLALELNIDPTPVLMVEEFKKKLAE